MTPSRTEIVFPPADLHGFDRLERLVDLARANRLEELFTEVNEQEDELEVATPEPLVLAQGLFQHRQPRILELADRALALFGLTTMNWQDPRVPWAYDAFELTFSRDVGDAWWRLETWREDVLGRGQNMRRSSFGDLEEFLSFLVPRLATLPPWPVATDSGREFVPHIIGETAWNDLEERAAREDREESLWDAWDLVVECCQRTLVVDTPTGPFPGLPDAIDRDALAAEARAVLERALDGTLAAGA